MTAIPRVFALRRYMDESGVSGTGTVAYGVEFPQPNGRVVLGWITGEANSVAIYDSVADVRTIHGHGGVTRVEYIDGEGAADA